MKKLKLTAIFAAIGGLLYRLGGSSAGTYWRDIGVSACFCALLTILGVVQGLWQWLSLLPTFGLMWGALTTYRYFLKKPADYKWWHYAMHGFFVAFAAIPYAFASGHWVGFTIRCIACSLLMGGWYFIAKWNDNLHEWGRGAIIVGSTSLFSLPI